MNGWWNGKGPFRSRPSSPPPPPPSHDLLLVQRKNLTSSSRMAMELSSKFRLLRPLLLMRSPFPARSRALQTLARPSPLSLLPSRGLPLLPPPHRFPLVLLRPFASVFPSPSPAPGRDHGPPRPCRRRRPRSSPPKMRPSTTSISSRWRRRTRPESSPSRPSSSAPGYTLLSVTLFRFVARIRGLNTDYCSIDLRSLQSQNTFNVIPPTSRATNYVVLRYYDVKGDPEVIVLHAFPFATFTQL
jgi:hypothetical protein